MGSSPRHIGYGNSGLAGQPLISASIATTSTKAFPQTPRLVAAMDTPRRVSPMSSRSSIHMPVFLPTISKQSQQTDHERLAACGGLDSFISVANLLHTVLDGLTDSNEFAKVVAAHSSDSEWLTALGTALRELGSLIEAGAGHAASRQHAFFVKLTQSAQESRAELSAIKTERDSLKAEVQSLHLRIAELHKNLEFERLVPGNGGSIEENPPKRVSTVDTDVLIEQKRAELDAELRKVKLLKEAVQSEKWQLSGSRSARSDAQKNLLRKQEETAAAELRHHQLMHQKHYSRIEQQLKQATAKHKEDFERREVEVQQKMHQQSLYMAELKQKAEDADLRAREAAVKASAAVDVLHEAQDEIKHLREEVALYKMQLQLAKATQGRVR